MSDTTEAAASADTTGAISSDDLAGLFKLELDAEGSPAPKAAPTTSETTDSNAAPDAEAAADDEISDSVTEEDGQDSDPEADPATPAIVYPSGMSEADKAVFAKLPPEAQAWVSKRETETRSDYTRKTQEIAEHRRAVEAERGALKQYLEHYGQILSRFTGQDLTPPDPALRQTDPIAFDDQMAAYVHAKHQQDVARKEFAKAQADHQYLVQQQRAEFIASQAEELKRLAPDLARNDDKGKALRRSVFQFATELGYSKQELEHASARDVAVLWKAHRYEAAQKAAKQAKPVPQQPPKVSKPGPAKAVGRPSNTARAIENLSRNPSRQALAIAYEAELASER